MSNDHLDDHDQDDFELTDDLSESIGYRADEEVDWEAVDPEEVERHDAIMESSAADLLKQDEGSWSDLERWAAAQVFAEEEHQEAFERLCRQLIEGDAAHPALDYVGIAGAFMSDLLMEERLDEAKALLPRMKTLDADEPFRSRMMEMVIAFLDEGREDEAADLLQSLCDDFETDAIALLDIADHLISCGQLNEAKEVLESVLEIAEEDNDQEIAEEARELLGELEDILSAPAEDA